MTDADEAYVLEMVDRYMLTRTSLYGLRTPASCVLYVAKRRRAACPRGPTHHQCTRTSLRRAVYLPRTVASQVDLSHTGTILRSEALAACATWKNQLLDRELVNGGYRPSQSGWDPSVNTWSSVCTIL